MSTEWVPICTITCCRLRCSWLLLLLSSAAKVHSRKHILSLLRLLLLRCCRLLLDEPKRCILLYLRLWLGLRLRLRLGHCQATEHTIRLVLDRLLSSRIVVALHEGKATTLWLLGLRTCSSNAKQIRQVLLVRGLRLSHWLSHWLSLHGGSCGSCRLLLSCVGIDLPIRLRYVGKLILFPLTSLPSTSLSFFIFITAFIIIVI